MLRSVHASEKINAVENSKENLDHSDTYDFMRLCTELSNGENEAVSYRHGEGIVWVDDEGSVDVFEVPVRDKAEGSWYVPATNYSVDPITHEIVSFKYRGDDRHPIGLCLTPEMRQKIGISLSEPLLSRIDIKVRNIEDRGDRLIAAVDAHTAAMVDSKLLGLDKSSVEERAEILAILQEIKQNPQELHQ